jgi:hypothetical protein
MITVSKIFVLVPALYLGLVSVAFGQTAGSRVAVDVNVGAQPQSRTINSDATVTLSDERASFTSTETIRTAPVFDAGVRYQLPRRFAVGVSISTFNRRGPVAVTGIVPDPVFYNASTTLNATAAGLRHSEVGAHVQVAYQWTLTNRWDLLVSGGPSVFRVSHDVGVANVAAALRTLTVGSKNESATAIGGHVDATLDYFAKPRYGVGAFVRYAGAKAKLPSISGLNIGGVQAGGGLRLRF